MLDVIFLVDGPYVSDYLKQTIYQLNIPVVKTSEAQKYLDESKTNFISEAGANLKLSENPNQIIYTNSENTLDWIYAHDHKGAMVGSIHKAKDKVLFRKVLEPQNPEFFYQEVKYEEIDSLNIQEIPLPVIIKPAIGFFSLGVYSIQKSNEWKDIITQIHETSRDISRLYPESVLDNTRFIIEELIEGEEFAVDCYYDHNGNAVVLNMMKHLFATETDMNDRVYITSTEILSQYLVPIQNHLTTIGKLLGYHDFPAHIELRIKATGEITTIEINPLRFGGWCSTPDLAQHTWGINIYELLFKGLKPDWSKIISQRGGKVYALVVLNNSTGVSGSQIKSFNYDQLLRKIDTPFELRQTDFGQFPVFGFLMCAVPEDDLSVLYELLHSDLSEYIKLK